VSGLTAADFVVRDEGVRQTVEVVDLTTSPLGAVLALDTSASVAGEKLAGLRAAAGAFVEGLREGDEAALLTFSHAIDLHAGPTRDRAAVAAALGRVVPIGSTALYDGLYAALRLPLAAHRRLVVLFTDGADNVSVLGAKDVEDGAASSEVLLYVVAAQEEQEGPITVTDADREPQREPEARRELRRLAESTGGRLLVAGDPGDLRRQFLRVLDEMRTRYILSFAPQGVRRDGLHRLDVQVKAPGVQVRARKTYRAAPRPAPR
jgi:VWFA-related protein